MCHNQRQILGGHGRYSRCLRCESLSHQMGSLSNRVPVLLRRCISWTCCNCHHTDTPGCQFISPHNASSPAHQAASPSASLCLVYTGSLPRQRLACSLCRSASIRLSQQAQVRDVTRAPFQPSFDRKPECFAPVALPPPYPSLWATHFQSLCYTLTHNNVPINTTS